MPPRKSTTSVTPAEADEAAGATPTATQQQLKAQAEGGVNVEDYLLPRSLTLRLAKSVLPPNTTIQKDAVLAIQKAATVFVNYVASHANEHTLKRTLAPADVLSALSELEFDSFRSRLERELAMHTELASNKRKAKKAGPEQTPQEKPEPATPATAGAVAEPPKAEKDTVPARGTKRVRREGETEGKPPVEDDDETEEEEEDEEQEEEDDDETQEEDQDEDEEEEEEEEVQNDNERIDDLDGDSSRRRLNPDLDSDAGSESDYDDGPGAQLREDLGLG